MTEQEEFEPTPEEQTNARYMLMQSARLAQQNGYSMSIWKNHPSIQEIRFKYKLRDDILDHVCAFVWTFRR